MSQHARAYTVILFLLGGFALMMLASHTFVIIPLMQDEGSDAIVLHFLRSLQAYEAILFAFCILVGV